MPDNYSVDIDELLRAKDALAALSMGEELAGKYLNVKSQTDGWEGTRGSFARSVGPQEKRDTQRIVAAVEALTGAFTATYDAFVAQISAVQEPQNQALEDIQNQASKNPGNVRR
ncbi:hypothetical protein HUT19_33430 [Streptomyces sp. NA02950]|uniref:hypothetical protein n=1 Tax=Streptomyces sp. NA02950 TaxID=2742137 RepID=UPI001590D1AD|nr:hypothetical protein [Streptomyces sp. NA02950]QKV96026.1 hypothetical protein HUT19_33430 [Streptomyces sp. NA02950]